MSYRITDRKCQNRLKVGTAKAKSQDAGISGKDFLKSHVLSWRRKVYSDWEDVTSSSRALQIFGQQSGKHGYQRLIA